MFGSEPIILKIFIKYPIVLSAQIRWSILYVTLAGPWHSNIWSNIIVDVSVSFFFFNMIEILISGL